jgi:hypothetical protein
MSSTTKILRSNRGVVLKEVSLNGPGGPLAVSYSVTTKRTPESWQTNNLSEANRIFDEELGRCRVPQL